MSASKKPVTKGIDTLTRRELEVIQLVAEGYTNQEIGSKLFIEESTVKHHMSWIMFRVDARTRAHAVAKLIRAGQIG